MRAPVIRRLRRQVAASLAGDDRIVLAVSGGVDSMVLLDAAAASLDEARLCVATFDHGTGAAATQAASLVRARAATLGVELVAGRATRPLRSEAALRDARWHFLRSAAAVRHARIATAHTIDDQVETVLMRVLRGAGARGLAGLYASSDASRPLLALSRRDVLRYASARGLGWAEDPSNAELAFLRNRVRHELLPALRRANRRVDVELLDVARAAAAWRRDLAEYVDRAIAPRTLRGSRGADVSAVALGRLSADELKVVWPDVAARVGLALDRRGTERVAEFALHARIGARIQLSGGWQVVRSRDAFQLRASEHAPPGQTPLPASGDTRWDRWKFRPTQGEPTADAWSTWLPAELPLAVRRWQPGDVMQIRRERQPRKVKYFLSDAGITGHERERWPVVVAGDQIVWIPGVRRSVLVTARSGWPALAFACEYIDR